ncbi:hypothetical protein [Brachybacterium subflavum]|uniref:hypothetical protein n=1 Tax=Brachybacterium subflavum TaxID=2585206 RepID=UPI0012668903|nr:hypothetical protein [Brachybacterium subflavum]
MTTDPTDLRERIARAICDADDAGGDNWTEDRDWYLAQADAVLPIVREAQAEAWERGRRAAYAEGVDRRYPIWERSPNPYRQETQR